MLPHQPLLSASPVGHESGHKERNRVVQALHGDSELTALLETQVRLVNTLAVHACTQKDGYVYGSAKNVDVFAHWPTSKRVRR